MKTYIKQARERAGRQQKECADKLGISLRAWQSYEQGIREPKFETLCEIADMFSVSTDYLLGRGDGEPSPLDELAGQFNMSLLEKKIVEGYLNLPPDMRDNLMDYLEKAVKEVQEESSSENPTPDEIPGDEPNAAEQDDEYEEVELNIAARGGNSGTLTGKKKKGESIFDRPDYRGGRR